MCARESRNPRKPFRICVTAKPKMTERRPERLGSFLEEGFKVFLLFQLSFCQPASNGIDFGLATPLFLRLCDVERIDAREACHENSMFCCHVNASLAFPTQLLRPSLCAPRRCAHSEL